MFTINKESLNYPIKIWLNNENDLEESCLEQAYNIASLPFLYKWACLMPDTHTGKGMPIGGILAAENVIIPNAVGSDIGCGMAFTQTNIKVSEFRDIITGSGSLLHCIIGNILRTIPVGYTSYKKKQKSNVIDNALKNSELYQKQNELFQELNEAYLQIGTLGGGNHFIELQEDDDGYLCIMVHSGSRHLGNQVCSYFHNKARQLNSMWFSTVPDSFRLAFLPVESEEGKDYINWMNLCLDYAYENRFYLLKKTKEIVSEAVLKQTGKSINFKGEINCHHNYASLETHYGKPVWIHRKGAIRAMAGELAVIPGAMGSYSYIVEGLGNPESFCSSSHGAGRKYSRKGAMENFTCEQVICDLKSQNVILGKTKKSDVAEESRFAYKDIETVMSNQKDLVKPIKRLKSIGVVKG